MLPNLRLFTNARRLHGCGELNELTGLTDFLLERLSGQLTAHSRDHFFGGNSRMNDQETSAVWPLS